MAPFALHFLKDVKDVAENAVAEDGKGLSATGIRAKAKHIFLSRVEDFDSFQSPTGIYQSHCPAEAPVKFWGRMRTLRTPSCL